ncbi:MAG: hypothetical protein Q7S89_02060 [bacterium]|nr:hypothetical protein [bacterium]
MKWRELYSGVSIRKQEDQPDGDLRDFFERMSTREVFVLDLFHSVTTDEEKGTEKITWAKYQLEVVIIQVRCTSGSSGDLEITCKTANVLPPGIRRGTYVLPFVDGEESFSLPDELFEDEDVWDDELTNWQKKRPKANE